MTNIDRLDGQVAIVTGGKIGIGKAMALAFAEAGADVVICGRTVEDGQLEAVADEIRGLGLRALAVQADISRKSDVDNLVQRTMDEFGFIDILVNNAGIMIRGGLLEFDEDDWDRIIDIDLKGSYLCSQAVGKRMVERKKGNIINITSAQAIRPRKQSAAYSIARAGLVTLTRVMAQELGPFNIRVNAIAASIVNTEMTADILADPEYMKPILATVPLGRISEPGDVVGAALFLVSDAASYITGDTISVDGGRLA